jgi:hypothetical protein
MNGSGMPTSQVSARFTEFIPISRRDNRLLQLWFQGREACSIHCWLLAAQVIRGSSSTADENNNGVPSYSRDVTRHA